MTRAHVTRQVWGGAAGPGGGPLNGYGSAVAKFTSVASAESHTRWRVVPGAARAPLGRGLISLNIPAHL